MACARSRRVQTPTATSTRPCSKRFVFLRSCVRSHKTHLSRTRRTVWAGQCCADGPQVQAVSTQLDAATRRVEELREEQRVIERYHSSGVQYDYGPGDVFASLAGRCVSDAGQRWTYEACFFERAAQKEPHNPSNPGATLGTWSHWQNDYTEVRGGSFRVPLEQCASALVRLANRQSVRLVAPCRPCLPTVTRAPTAWRGA